MTLADRISKKTLIARAPSKHAKIVTNAVIKLLLPEKEQLETITFDNGKEFAYHAQIKRVLGAVIPISHTLTIHGSGG